MFQQVDQLKNQLQILRGKKKFHPDTEKSIREKYIVDWTYHSNAIEGNRLSLMETRVVLESGITIGGKPLKDHLEAIDHKEAILFIEELTQKKERLNESMIKKIHAIVLQRIRPRDAGQYRSVPVAVGNHIPPQPWEVQLQMEQFLNRYHGEWSHLHPLQRIAYLHCDFVRIHPFIDGNGRTARLITNLELMKQDYPPVILPVDKRIHYYEALQSYDETRHIDDFLKLLIALTQKTLQFYLSLAM